MQSSKDIILDAEVPHQLAGKRLDQVAAELFADYSRSRLQQWIKSGDLRVDGRALKPKDKLAGGEWISVSAELQQETEWRPEPIDLDIIYEDEALLVINKPVGLVVHPAAGHAGGTLVNGLLHHCPELEAVPRAGIVHRIDKDTSGLLVVAKTLTAHKVLVERIQAKDVEREYQAIVVGRMTGGGTVNAPIARHPTHRIKMAVVPGGKPSVSHYRVLQRLREHTHVYVKLDTGRTHQIRVHMAHIQYPLVGDHLYGVRLKLPKAADAELREALQRFKRQALHAFRLTLAHPLTDEVMSWEAPLPGDMTSLLNTLKKDADAHGIPP